MTQACSLHWEWCGSHYNLDYKLKSNFEVLRFQRGRQSKLESITEAEKTGS